MNTITVTLIVHRENKGSDCFPVIVMMIKRYNFIVSLIGDLENYETKIYYINADKNRIPL